MRRLQIYATFANEVVSRVGSFPLRNFAQRLVKRDSKDKVLRCTHRGKERSAREMGRDFPFSKCHPARGYIRELYLTFADFYAHKAQSYYIFIYLYITYLLRHIYVHYIILIFVSIRII